MGNPRLVDADFSLPTLLALSFFVLRLGFSIKNRRFPAEIVSMVEWRKGKVYYQEATKNEYIER